MRPGAEHPLPPAVLSFAGTLPVPSVGAGRAQRGGGLAVRRSQRAGSGQPRPATGAPEGFQGEFEGLSARGRIHGRCWNEVGRCGVCHSGGPGRRLPRSSPAPATRRYRLLRLKWPAVSTPRRTSSALSARRVSCGWPCSPEALIAVEVVECCRFDERAFLSRLHWVIGGRRDRNRVCPCQRFRVQ